MAKKSARKSATTSKAMASKAAKALRDPRSSAITKSLAASVLRQRP